MNITTKNLLTIVVLGSVALGFGVTKVYANQPKPSTTIISPQNNNQNEIPEISDGDGEVNDATESPDYLSRKQDSQETKQNEDQEDTNDSDRTSECNK